MKAIKDYILPLIFTKRLCDVFDDELNRIDGQIEEDTSLQDLFRTLLHELMTAKNRVHNVDPLTLKKATKCHGNNEANQGR